MIEVEGPDGAVIEFPDGTPPETIKGVMAKRYAAPSAPQRTAPHGLTQSLAQGASFGFADELTSGLFAGTVGTGKGVVNAVRERDLSAIPRAIGAEFTDLQTQQREARNAARERDPVGTFVGEIAGGALTGVLTGGKFIGGGKTLAEQSLRGAAVGTGQGAIAGAGFAEGGLQDRAKGAAVGGAIGAPLGAAAPVLTNRVAQFWQARTSGTRVPDEVKRSYDSLVKVLERDLGSRGKAEAAVRKFVAAGAQGDILDIAGGKTLARIREVATRNPDSALAFVDDIRQSATQEVRAAVAGTVNTKGGTIRTGREALKLARQQQAGPLFRQASQTPVPAGFADDLISERPAVRAAVQKAARELANSQELTPFEVLKVAKENLDDRVSGLLRAGNGAEARRVAIARDELRSRLTKLSPEYRQALDLWSGSKAADDALEKGAQFLKPTYSPEDLAADVGKMTKSEREFFRVAVAEQFEDAIGNTKDGLNVARRFSTPAIRDKVRALFSDNPKEGEAFIAILKRAEDRVRKANIIDPFGGSQTQPRGAASADFLAEASGPVTRSANTVTQAIASPTQIPQRAVTALAGRRGEAQAQRVSEVLADAIFAGKPVQIPFRSPQAPSALAGRASPALLAPAQNRE